MTAWIVLGLVLKVTVVLAVGIVAVRALRGRSAAIRHGALVVTTCAAVALPILTLALPGWNVPLFDRAGASDAAVATISKPIHAEGLTGSDAGGATAPGIPAKDAGTVAMHSDLDGSAYAGLAPPRDRNDSLPWLPAILAVWALGATLVLGRYVLDVAGTRALLRDAVDAPEGMHARAGVRIADRLGLRRPVRVLFSESLSVPVTWGVRRPVVVLPLEAWEWEAERIRIVMLHELAHVRRLDCVSSAIAVVASALWWFHPLQWVCRRRLRVEQERACDDVVLLDGVGPTDYAEILMEFARGLSPIEESGTARAAIAMARRSTLRDRVETILSAGSRSVRLNRRTVGLLSGVALALLLPLAAVHVWGETAEARRRSERTADLESADPRTREAAAWELGSIGDEMSIDPLIARLEDPEPRVRGVAGRSLGKLGGARARDALFGLLRDPDPYVRELAVLGLEEIPGSRVLEALVPMLHDPEMGVRSVTVSTLVRRNGDRAVLALADAAENDADPHTRGMALSGLAERGSDASAAVPTLARILTAEDLEMRRGAAWAMGLIGDPKAVPDLVARLEGELDPEVRKAIVYGLKPFADDPRAVEGLLAALRDPEWLVREGAAAALAGSDDPRASAALVAALHDPVHQVRLESEWSLDSIEARR